MNQQQYQQHGYLGPPRNSQNPAQVQQNQPQYQQQPQQQNQQPNYGYNQQQQDSLAQDMQNMALGGAAPNSYNTGYQPQQQQPQQMNQPYANGMQSNGMQQQQPQQPQQQQQQQYQQQPMMGQQHQTDPLAQYAHVKLVDPRFVSLTADCVPQSQALATRSNFPFGVHIRPMANVGEELPFVNFGSSGVIRCKDCRAYVNPFCSFQATGMKSYWTCNLCGVRNEAPANYACQVDANGFRTDIQTRPELMNGSYEIVAPEEYMVRQPMRPVYVFLIDVSVKAVQSGMVASVASGIQAALDTLPGGSRTQVGFITFDSTVHFYALRPGANGPVMHVNPDLETPVQPWPCDLLVNLHEARDQVDVLLSSLASMHQKTTNVESCLGPAIESAMNLMVGLNAGAPLDGGRLSVFASQLATLGKARLTNRDKGMGNSTDQEHVLQKPSTDFFKRTGVNMSRYQIVTDTYLCPQSYADTTTISQLAQFTGGNHYYYPAFTHQTRGECLENELKRNVCRVQGWEAVVRTRCSVGMQLSNFNGNFNLRGTDLLAIPGCTSEGSFTCTIKNQEQPLKTRTCTIQSALLYTTSTGERRIRVHNALVPVVNDLSSIYERGNPTAVLALLSKQALSTALSGSFAKARETVKSTVLQLCRQKESAMRHRAFVDPLANLPAMTLTLLRSKAFRPGNVSADERSAYMNHLRAIGLPELTAMLTPRLLPLTDLPQGFIGSLDENNIVNLPQEVALASNQLVGGIHLLDNGVECLIRVAHDCPPSLLGELFGVNQLSTQPMMLQHPVSGDTNGACARLWNIVNSLRMNAFRYQPVIVAMEGTAQEIDFLTELVHDRTQTCMSLGEFVAQVGNVRF